MSGKKKRAHYKENLKNFSVPLPWDVFVDIMKKDFGFEYGKKSGSARTLVKDDVRITVDEPHGVGDKIVHKEDRKKAIRYLIYLGLIEE